MTTIVHLFGTLDPGGAELRTLEELRARTRPDEQHVVIALSGRAGVLDPLFEAVGCDVVHHRLSPGFPLWMVRFLRRRRATHLHSHVHLASGYFLLLGVIASVPRRIAHFRSVGDGRGLSLPRRAYRAVGRSLVGACATDVVAVSGAVRDALFAQGSRLHSRCRVIHNRIDRDRFPEAGPARPGRARLIMVGRVDADKNPLRGVAVLAELVRRDAFVDVSLSVVGRSSAEALAELRQRALDLGVGDAVDILGQRDDVPTLLAGADLLLSTTFREGLPGAILEAAATGIPAVVSAIAPNEEVAGWLSNVAVVGLDAGDDEWCSAIEAAIRERTGRLSPDKVRAEFDRTPFALVGPNEELDRLWS